jgi:flagellar biosynthesis protein FlhB
MPIHKFQFSRQVGNHFPKKVGIYLVSILYFFLSFNFLVSKFCQKKFQKSLAKLFELTHRKKKKKPIFSPQKITKWWKSAKNKTLHSFYFCWVLLVVLLDSSCCWLVSSYCCLIFTTNLPNIKHCNKISNWDRNFSLKKFNISTYFFKCLQNWRSWHLWIRIGFMIQELVANHLLIWCRIWCS